MTVIDIKNCTVRLRGGAVGTFIDVKIGNGNLTYNEKRNIDYIKDRGKLDTVREGDEEPIDVRLDAEWRHITNSGGTEGVPSIEDALKNQGAAAGWTSSSADPCEPYSVDVVILDVPLCNTDTPETIILTDYRWTSLAHDLRAGTISTTGTCNVKRAAATRGAVQSY